MLGSCDFSKELLNSILSDYSVGNLEVIEHDNSISLPDDLLNPSPSTNFIFKVIGKLTDEEIENINQINTPTKVHDRVKSILEKASLRFVHIESSIFQGNLTMRDSSLPIILAELILLFYLKIESSLLTLACLTEEINPLKFDIPKSYNFYTYKIKRFLSDLAFGMCPTEVWNGELNKDRRYLISEKGYKHYSIYNRNEFEDYLLENTRLINPSSTRNNFGIIYKEKGNLYIKLNLQIRFIK
jgi:type II restriction enzyme